MRRILTMLFVSVFMLSLCPLHAQETETLVLIDTDMGKIKVKLFNARRCTGIILSRT